MRNYEESKRMRDEMLEEIFNRTMKIEDFVRDNWQKENYLPNNDEIKYACNQICIIIKETAKPAFEGQEDLYKRFCRECEEIKNRFQKLNPSNATAAACGVYQVGHYLHDEAYDLISEALDIYVPSADYDCEY